MTSIQQFVLDLSALQSSSRCCYAIMVRCSILLGRQVPVTRPTDSLPQATVELLRNGKKMDAEISLSSVNRLIPEHLDNRPPSYLILAGLIFTQVSPVTSPLLSLFKSVFFEPAEQ